LVASDLPTMAGHIGGRVERGIIAWFQGLGGPYGSDHDRARRVSD
jgi:hypothetical protein